MPSRRRFGVSLRLCFHIYFAVARLIIFFIERQRSGDAPLVARTQQRLVLLSFS